MFNKSNLKVLFFGISLFLINIFILFEKLSHENYRYYDAVRADMMDGYFGFIILSIFSILSISVISYGLGIESKLSKIGNYIVYIFLKLIGRK